MKKMAMVPAEMVLCEEKALLKFQDKEGGLPFYIRSDPGSRAFAMPLHGLKVHYPQDLCEFLDSTAPGEEAVLVISGRGGVALLTHQDEWEGEFNWRDLVPLTIGDLIDCAMDWEDWMEGMSLHEVAYKFLFRYRDDE